MLFIYHTHILWFRLASHWCVECRCQLPVSKLCWHIKWGSMQQYRPWSRSTEIFRSAWGLFGNETKPQHCIRPIDQCNSISMIHENANSFLVLCHDDNTKDVWIWEVIIDEECAYTHTVSSPFMECIQSVSAFSLSGVNDILPEHADIANLINIPNEDSTVMLLRLEVGKIWLCILKFNLWLRKLISLRHNFRLCFLRSTRAEAGSLTGIIEKIIWCIVPRYLRYRMSIVLDTHILTKQAHRIPTSILSVGTISMCRSQSPPKWRPAIHRYDYVKMWADHQANHGNTWESLASFLTMGQVRRTCWLKFLS